MKAIAASLIVAVIGSTGLWYASDGLQALTAEGARRISVAHEQAVVPNVALETMAGKNIRLVSTQPKATLVEFIYTSCPTICQSAGENFANIRDQLMAEGLADNVKLMSISFDPVNDGVAELKTYADAHGARGVVWTIAKPSQTDLSELLKVFGVTVIANEFNGFEHNVAIHVVNPDGRLVEIVDIDDIAGAVRAAQKVLQ